MVVLTDSLSDLQIIFIIVASVVLAAGLIIAIFVPLRIRYRKKQYKEFDYKKVYQIAFDNDYYLINKFLFRISSTQVGNIDHILFADKYIYLIHDYYYNGDLTGNFNDQALVLINKDGQKAYVDNPLIESAKILNSLSNVTAIDKNMFIGICLLNDECRYSVEHVGSQLYLIQRNKLKTLIKTIESRDIGKINPEQLQKVVKAIDKLNRRKKTKAEEK